ncbi:hypothetical protein F4803DRAFT_556636 [Xylaria telfairii]|nr:hypothetical protein F4803DRAFT_556636 [Xylaria telfairii]
MSGRDDPQDESENREYVAKEFKKTFCTDVEVYFLGLFDCVANVGFFLRRPWFGKMATNTAECIAASASASAAVAYPTPLDDPTMLRATQGSYSTWRNWQNMCLTSRPVAQVPGAQRADS